MFNRYGIAMIGEDAPLCGEYLELLGIRSVVQNHVLTLWDCSQIPAASAALADLGVN